MGEVTMSERLPWAKWTWAHWENDEALALCSMAAQGFWMRLLCIAAKESGLVLVAGKAPPVEDLAFITRQSADDVRGWLEELERRGVFSRDGKGQIYSRRMTRDAKIARRNQKNGKLGGNPKLRKDTENDASDNPVSLPPDKAEEELEEERETPVVPKGTEPRRRIVLRQADVEAIWQATPPRARSRTSRSDVEEALKAAARRGHAPAEVLVGIAGYYAAPDVSRDDHAFAKGAHRIIAKDRWKDFVGQGGGVSAPAVARTPDDRWRRSIRRFQASAYWNTTDDGPKPGKPGCQVPAEILSEFGLPPPSAEGGDLFPASTGRSAA
jgi:hypothetical protein